jgi:hypothetical protein
MRDLDMPVWPFDRVQELDGSAVPKLAAEGGPGLSSHMAGGDDAPTSDPFEEQQRSLVMPVAIVGASDEERSVGEDQGSGFDGP